MAGLQQLKRRITAVKSTRQVTQAMELVSATKMRKAQETALNSRGYALTALEMLANITESLTHHGQIGLSLEDFPLLAERPVKKVLIVLVAADRGLAGSFNSNVFRRWEKYTAAEKESTGADYEYLTVGQRAAEYIARNNWPIAKSFAKFGDVADLDGVEPLSDFICQGYAAKKWDKVLVYSTHFFSTLHQEVLERQLLPVRVDRIRATVEEMIPETGRYAELRHDIVVSRPEEPVDYIVEPEPATALKHLNEALVRMQIYHMVLEANASEHSARRTAMKNATDNAGELVNTLSLTYNRNRQAAITQELTEIVGTASAME